MSDYSEFRKNFFNSINKKNNASGVLDILRKWQKSVYRTFKLPSPYEKYTDNFISEFSTKAILFILHADILSDEEEISKIFGKLLIGFIKIFIQFIDKPVLTYVPYIEAATKIFDGHAQFYTTTSKPSFFSSSNVSQYLVNNIKVLSSSNIIDRITAFFSNVHEPLFAHFYATLNFIRLNGSQFSASPYKKCIETAFNQIIKITQRLDGNNLRDIDEKQANATLSLLNKFVGGDYSDVIVQTTIETNAKFATSAFLDKKFAGLSAIKNFLTNRPKLKFKICSILF